MAVGIRTRQRLRKKRTGLLRGSRGSRRRGGSERTGGLRGHRGPYGGKGKRKRTGRGSVRGGSQANGAAHRGHRRSGNAASEGASAPHSSTILATPAIRREAKSACRYRPHNVPNGTRTAFDAFPAVEARRPVPYQPMASEASPGGNFNGELWRKPCGGDLDSHGALRHPSPPGEGGPLLRGPPGAMARRRYPRSGFEPRPGVQPRCAATRRCPPRWPPSNLPAHAFARGAGGPS